MYIIIIKYRFNKSIRCYKRNREVKAKIPIQSYEGFLRQIVGWREYMRYCYEFYYDDIIKSNYFNNKKNYQINGMKIILEQI